MRQPKSKDAQDTENTRKTLQAIADDPSAPASARVQAARTLAEMSGQIGRLQRTADGQRPVRDLTRAELEAELVSLRAARSGIALPF